MALLRSLRFALFAGTAAIAAPAFAQSAAPLPSDPAIVPPPIAKPAGTGRVYVPADFARFAPKTAYDMLVQVPGFTIRTNDTGDRGLGQAKENVLINGERINNKSYGGGASGAVDELQRTSIGNVERIEIVEAASLGIAGLSGQVANVITIKTQKKATGQFEWSPDIRAHFAKPRWESANASYSGSRGALDYTFSVKNSTGRGGFGGPYTLRDPAGQVFETRDEFYHGESDLLTFQTKLSLHGPGSSIGHLTLGYTPYWNPSYDREIRTRADGNDSTRITRTKLDGWYYDVNADYEFGVGPGRLKLIGLQHRDHEPVITTQVQSYTSGAPDTGLLFTRDSIIVERVGRGEYHWKGGKNDWQISLERAFNSLDQRGGLALLNTSGVFDPVPFPEGSGKVQEMRYEGIATLSRPLASNLDLQIAAGAEISKLERVDGDLPPRKFFRPKGSIVLGWRPAEGWDASLKFRRKVGQISFYDFLDQPNLQQDRENNGNPDLVPPQSWEIEGEVGHELGPWGKTRLRAYRYWIQDIIDTIPIGVDGQGVGNLPKASEWGLESTSTVLFDPIGWKGAKLDVTVGYDHTRVRDPLTGQIRAISGNQNFWTNLDFRHDIPGTELAWGGNYNYSKVAPYTRLTEVFRSWEGPNWLSAYVEHKNVMGLVVRVGVSNILNARHRLVSTVYTGYRDTHGVSYSQDRNQLIGPIFTLNVKGTF
jgi:hypothetical protein